MLESTTPVSDPARQTIHEAALTPQQMAWCLEQIRERCSPSWQISEAHGVPSRLGSVFRLVARTPHGEATLFLKSYGTSERGVDLAERFQFIQQVGGAFERSDTVSAYRVVGCDARLGFLLTMKTPGESLIAIHSRMTHRLGLGDTSVALRGWRGLGEWLGTLHWKALPARQSEDRVVELTEYTKARLLQWAAHDRSGAKLAGSAVEALSVVSQAAARRPVTMTPCHGDVSASNVIIGTRVSLIDPDDMRFDMPGLDISQSLMELGEFGHVLSVIPLRRFLRAAEEAFTEGYGRPLPEGAEFWLPHLRNLSVYLLTLARRCHGVSVYRLTEEARYHRAICELKRCVRGIQ